MFRRQNLLEMNWWRFIFVLSIVQAINGLRYPSFFSGDIRIDKNNAGIAPLSEAHRTFEVIEHCNHQHQTGDSNCDEVTFDNGIYQNIKNFYFFSSFRHWRSRRAAHNRSLFSADQTFRRKFNCYMLPLDGVDGEAATDDETWIDMKENANERKREWEKQHIDVNSCSDSSISSDERVSNPAVSGPASSTSDDPSTGKVVNLGDNDGEEDKLPVTAVGDGLDSLDRSTITRESLFQIIEDSWQRVEKLIPAETLALCESDLKSATSLIVLAAIRRTADTYPERSASRAVAEGMLQAADRNNDGQLSVSEWFDWLSAGTRSYSSAFRRRQEEAEVESRIAGAPGERISGEKRVVATGSGSREREVGGHKEKQEQQQSGSGRGSTVPLPQTMADGLNEVLGHSVCSLKVIARMSNDPAILSAAFVAGGMVSGVLDEGVCRNMLGRMSPFARELVVHALSLESASSLMSTSVTATTSLHSITGTDSSVSLRSQPLQPRASPPMVSTSSSKSQSRTVFSNSSQSRNEELISVGVEADAKALTLGRKSITSYDGDSGSARRITNSAENGLESSSNGYGFTSENITRGMTSTLHGSSSNKTQMAKKQQLRSSERPEDMARERQKQKQSQSPEEKGQQEQQRLLRLGNEREQNGNRKIQVEQQKGQFQLEVGRARARAAREKRSMVTVDLSEIPLFTAPPIDDDAKSVLSSPSSLSSAFPSLSSLSPPSLLGQAPNSASFTEEESVTAAHSAASFPSSPSPSSSLFNRTDTLHPDREPYPPLAESQNIPAINDTAARSLTRDQFYLFREKPLSIRPRNGEVDDSENGIYNVNKSDIKSSRDGSVEIEGIQDESEDEGGIITTTLPRRFTSPTSAIQSLIESSPFVGAFLPVGDVRIEQRQPSSYYTHLRGEWVPVSLAEEVTRAAVQSAATVAPNPFSSSESDNSLSIEDTQTASPLSSQNDQSSEPDSTSRTAESIAEYIAEDLKKHDATTEWDVFSQNLDPLDKDAQTAFASNAVLQQGYIEGKKNATDRMPSEVNIDHIEGAVYVPSSRNSRKLSDVATSVNYSPSSTEKPAAVNSSSNVQRGQDAVSGPVVFSRKKGAARSVTISAAGTILTSESEVIFGDTSLPSQQGYPPSTSSAKRRQNEDQHRVEDSGVRRGKIQSGDEERLGSVQDLRSRIVGEDEQGIELKHEKGQQLDGLVQRMGKVMREAVKLRSSLQDLDDPQASLMRQSLYESSAHRKDVLGLVMALRAARLLHARRLPPYARHQLALDTLQLWSPLSFQVGLAAHTPELEVHSYVHLFPQSFGSFINWYHAFRPTAKSLLRSLRADLEYQILNDGSGILPKYTEKVEIQSRLKTPSSAFKKMLRGAKVKDQLFDIIGLRSIIREKPEFRGRLVHPTSSLSASCILHSRPDAAESRSDDDSFKATMNRTENGGSIKVMSNSTANIGGANGVGNSVSFTRGTYMSTGGDRWVETDHASIMDNLTDVRKRDKKGKRSENKTCDGISEECGEALDDEGNGEGQRSGAESEGLVDVEKLLVWRLYEILSGLEGWRENTHRFKDYVNYPKPSGYQSLHVSLQHIATGIHMEVQIRSERMHWIAEHGPASHSNYKALVLPPANDAV